MKKYSLFIFIAFFAIGLSSCKKKKEAPAPEKSAITIEDFSTSIDENPKHNTPLGKIIAKASNPKASLTFEIVSQSVVDAISIDPTSGDITVNNQLQFDFETNPYISAKCMVKASGISKTANISISLKDLKEPFVTKWKTTAKNQPIYIYQSRDMNGDLITNYKFTVDWGDKSQTEDFEDNSFVQDPNYYGYTIHHKYTEPGDYIVTITGQFPGLSFLNQNDFKTVLNWGDNQWTTMGAMFSDCKSLNTFEAKDKPNLINCISMSDMFYGASAFNHDIKDWNTQNVTNMSYMFFGASAFNQDIKDWNTQNVIDMSYMFADASAFNQDIKDWNTKNVEDMSHMFAKASAFNQDIKDWDTQNVINMSYMFFGASAFNQDIKDWNTQNVIYMSYMFAKASAFNQDIKDWNTQNVKDMSYMFAKAYAFNQDIKDWKVDNVQQWRDFATGSPLKCHQIPERLGKGQYTCTP